MTYQCFPVPQPILEEKMDDDSIEEASSASEESESSDSSEDSSSSQVASDQSSSSSSREETLSSSPSDVSSSSNVDDSCSINCSISSSSQGDLRVDATGGSDSQQGEGTTDDDAEETPQHRVANNAEDTAEGDTEPFASFHDEERKLEHSPGPFTRRGVKKQPSSDRMLVDVGSSVHFEPPPSTGITHSQLPPTLPNNFAEDESAETAPSQIIQDERNTKPLLDPSIVVKPSFDQGPSQPESRTFLWRVFGVACLGIAVILMLLVLSFTVMQSPEPPVDPRLEQYANAIVVRDSAEIVLRELIETTKAAATTISARSLRLDWPQLDDFELLASMTRAKATILAPLVVLEKRMEWQNFAKSNTGWVETSRTMAQDQERIQRHRRVQNGSAVLDSVTIIDDTASGVDAVTDSVTIDDGGTASTDETNDSVTIDDTSTDDSVPMNDNTSVTDDDLGSGTFDFFNPTIPDVVQPVLADDEPAIRVPFAIHAAPRGDPLGRDHDAREYLPIWQLSPIPTDDLSIVNFDMLRQPLIRRLHVESKTTHSASISPLFGNSRVLLDDAFVFDGALTNVTSTAPLFAILEPVFNRMRQPNHIDGFLLNIYSWEDLAWRSPSPVKLVVENNCGSSSFCFDVTEAGMQYVGANAWETDETFVTTDFVEDSNHTSTCEYSLSFKYKEVDVADINNNSIAVIIMTAFSLVLISVGTVLLVQAMSQQSQQYDLLVDQGIQQQGDKLGHYVPQRPTTRRSFWFGDDRTEKEKMKDDNVQEERVKIDTADATVVVRKMGERFWKNSRKFFSLFSMPC